MIEPIFYTKTEETNNEYARFVFEPLQSSFGNSIGNSLRRTLLSSLKGAAITSVKVSHASHLFSTIKGVKESMLEIVLNLKQLRFSVTGEGPFKINLTAKGGKKLFGKDIKGEVKVVNEDLYLAEITDDKAALEIEAVVETGYGFVSTEEKGAAETGYISIDSSFSPVKRVNFKIEEARVGRKSNFERLILEVWTDGTITPEQAVKDSAAILSQQFSHILSGKDVAQDSKKESAEVLQKEESTAKVYETIIDELNLPSRVINALLRENIETVADLVKRGKDDLVGLKGVGRKSIDLIEEELQKMGIELK